MTSVNFDPTLMFITDPGIGSADEIEARVAAALLGGAGSIQLRDKRASDVDLVILTHRLLTITRASGVPLIVDDRPSVAEAAGADGVHVGQSDMTPEQARRHIAQHRLLGLSVTSVEEARAVDPEIVDYVGVGPVFATTSKSDAVPPLGLERLRQIGAVLRVPALAIGGITAQNAEAVIRAGVDGVAVISAIAFASNAVVATAAISAAARRGLVARDTIGVSVETVPS